jgi:hypothetical protein
LPPVLTVAGSIELKPGVMFCMRRFHELITDFVRGAWLRYVRRFNGQVLGAPIDLDQFLFGAERAICSTRAYRSLGGAESNGCHVPPRTIRSRLDRSQCAKVGACRSLGLLAGRCHTRASVGKTSRVSANRRIMRASARVTMEVETSKIGIQLRKGE